MIDQSSSRHQRPIHPTGHSVRVCGISLLMVLLLATSLAAQIPRKPRQAGPKHTQQILQGFEEQLRQIDGFLVEDQPRKAYKLANQLLRHMTNQLISGPDVSRLLGVAIVLRALAAYQLGDEAEALWHWHVACQMWPKAKDLKMTAYGDAGPFLKSHLLGKLTGEVPPEGPELRVPTSRGEVRPPRQKKTPQIETPAAKRRGQPVTVIVQVIIGTDGRPRSPRIISSEGEPTLIFAAFDALRKWEFEPATVDGVPFESYYNLSVNFRV